MGRRCCRLSLLLLLLIPTLASLTSAYDFYVGGRDGWVLNPRESYNSWTGKMRFQVNDKLVFIYKKGEDSVLQVTKEAYDSCNRSKPIRVMDTGNSIFQLDRSGPFYFISGTSGRCQQGQKLIVTVMADRRHHTPSTIPPAPAAKPPKAPAPGPASSTVPAPSAEPPATVPTMAPSPSSTVPTPASSTTAPPATSPVSSVGVPSPTAVPPTGTREAPGPSAGTGSASSVLSVSRVSLAVVTLVLAGVFIV